MQFAAARSGAANYAAGFAHFPDERLRSYFARTFDLLERDEQTAYWKYSAYLKAIAPFAPVELADYTFLGEPDRQSKREARERRRRRR